MAVVLGVVQPAEGFVVSQAEGSARIEDIFRDHYPRIVGMLARLIGDGGQAEEIASDVFSKLSRQESDRRNVTPWLYQVATNAGLDALRVNARRLRREYEAHAENLRSAASDTALEEILRAERCARVQEVLAALKPRDAQLLLLRADGLAYRELAQTLGVQPGSIGTLLARAEAEFERKFRARYGDSV